MIYRLGLTVIIILAALLRFWRLGRWSFWADEALTFLDAQNFPHLLRINPLPYALVKLTTALLGRDEWGARFGFALIGVLSVPVIYLIASRLYDKKTGLISALLLALLPWHIFWSQNARSYSLVLLWSLLSSGLFYLAFERDSLSYLLSSMFFILMLIGSHLLSGVLVLGFLAYLISIKILRAERPGGYRRRNILIFISPILLVTFAALHPRVFGFITSGWGHNIWARSPIYVAMTLAWGVTVPVAVAAIFVLSDDLILKRSPSRPTLLLACWSIVPLAFFVLGSLFQNVAGYYLFFTVPAYLILAARACRIPDRRIIVLLLVAVLGSEMIGWDYLYFTRENGGRPMWREAFRLVGERMKSDDLVVSTIPALARCYLPEANFVKIDAFTFDKSFSQTDGSSIRISGGRQMAEGERYFRNRRRIWFILDESNMNVIDPDHRLRDHIAEEGRFIRRFPVYSRASDRSITVFLVSRHSAP
ncbi:glycosyltransferase family 39 protein [Candidatus Poribacteria bacterium]|nr:glycosyltransferase family 39 protein [Candidatus Poribacteria bacterium]